MQVCTSNGLSPLTPASNLGQSLPAPEVVETGQDRTFLGPWVEPEGTVLSPGGDAVLPSGSVITETNMKHVRRF